MPLSRARPGRSRKPPASPSWCRPTPQLPSRIGRINFRGRTPDGVRPDAVMYCLGAMERYEEMTPQRVQGVGFEIAVLGMQGIDPADPERLYTLKSLPGQFSGLQLLCVMYVAFRQVAPERDTGFDVSREYAVALSMHNPEAE